MSISSLTAVTPPRSLDTVRGDFPALRQKVHGKRYAFLDSAASSLKPRPVVETMSDYLLYRHANIHRGVYHFSQKATEDYEAARSTVARFFGCDEKDDVLIFTRGATEAINLAAVSLAAPRLQKGGRILLTQMEHHSNLVPWQALAKQHGACLDFCKIRNDGTLDTEHFETLLKKGPSVAAFIFSSNVLGTVTPVKKLTALAKQAGAFVLVDAAQAAPHMPLDFHASGADAMAVSAHKMLGPTGIGALLGKRELLENAEPYQYGGDMILTVSFEGSTWNEVPQKFEAGTPAIAEALGWAEACRYLDSLGWKTIHEHEKALLQKATDVLLGDSSVTIYGPQKAADRCGVISFSMKGLHPHDIATVLDSEGIAVRAGHHCAQPLMKVLGVVATVRLSVALYNNDDDFEQLTHGLKRVHEVMKK